MRSPTGGMQAPTSATDRCDLTLLGGVGWSPIHRRAGVEPPPRVVALTVGNACATARVGGGLSELRDVLTPGHLARPADPRRASARRLMPPVAQLAESAEVPAARRDPVVVHDCSRLLIRVVGRSPLVARIRTRGHVRQRARRRRRSRIAACRRVSARGLSVRAAPAPRPRPPGGRSVSGSRGYEPIRRSVAP